LQVFFNFKVTYKIIYRINRSYEFVDNYNFEILPPCLFKKLTFRTNCRTCYQSYIMTTAGQFFAGNQGIFLCAAENQTSYYMNDFQYLIHIKHNPQAGAIGPAAVRSFAARISLIFSGRHLPLPTSASVPTIFLTMLYKKPSASTSI